MSLGIGQYYWSVGVPFDKLNERWFHAHNNDNSLFFDGVGHYSLSVDDKGTEESMYALEGDSVIITLKSSDNIGNRTIENNYHELYCNKYAEVFIK